MAQWEEFHLHVFSTNLMGIVGVTEIQYMVMAACLGNNFFTDQAFNKTLISDLVPQTGDMWVGSLNLVAVAAYGGAALTTI